MASNYVVIQRKAQAIENLETLISSAVEKFGIEAPAPIPGAVSKVPEMLHIAQIERANSALQTLLGLEMATGEETEIEAQFRQILTPFNQPKSDENGEPTGEDETLFETLYRLITERAAAQYDFRVSDQRIGQLHQEIEQLKAENESLKATPAPVEAAAQAVPEAVPQAVPQPVTPEVAPETPTPAKTKKNGAS